jgi:hypothetical protein
VTGFHRREPAPGPVHRCAAGANDCGPRTHASGVTVQSRPRSPARAWLRGREWERITRGVYAPSLSRTQFEELAAWQLVLPRTAAFSHLTAARLRGWWVPATVAHPIFAAMLNADPRPRRPGLLVCRHTQPFPMNLVGGLRVTTAAETGCSDGPGIHVGWPRGRACSTTRSLDGLAAPAPTATGAAPLPKTGQMQQGDGRNLGGT